MTERADDARERETAGDPAGAPCRRYRPFADPGGRCRGVIDHKPDAELARARTPRTPARGDAGHRDGQRHRQAAEDSAFSRLAPARRPHVIERRRLFHRLVSRHVADDLRDRHRA